MLVLISPAKTLDFSSSIPNNLTQTIPIFAKESKELVNLLKKYSAKEISQLMSISDKLGELNYQRFQNFDHSITKAAIYAYKGDVYQGLELEKYSLEDLNFANQTIKIISGLYGLLKPLDLIAPYRLEMSIALPNPQGKNLYDFWKKKLTNQLNHETADCIINLASQEYSSAIGILNKPKIDITFKEEHKGEYKIIGIHAKKARGVMANYIVRNSIKEPEVLKNFNENGYRFASEFSKKEEYVFIR